MADILHDDDDTLETGYESVLDTLNDTQYLKYLEDGSLPHGVSIPSSSEKVDSEDEEPSSDEAETEQEEDNDNSETKVEETEEEESDSNSDDNEEQASSSDTEPTETEDKVSTAFKELFSKPIKANGTEFVLESFDEAISLIQKGVGYEAKMKKLKPSQKIIKSLEQNKISEADVNFLIDLHKGDKTAIKELLEKHNLDTFQIDEVTDKYETNSKNLITDDALKLSLNAEAIAESEYADRIDKVIFDTWDEESKNFIAQRPETLLELLGEFQLGRFDAIQAMVARENALGKNNVPDIVRYGELAAMYEKGELKLNTPTVPKQAEEAKKSAKPAAKAAPAPKKVSKKSPSDYSPKELDKMSDAEYMQLFGS